MEDADVSAAASAAVQGMNFTWTAGQSCGSTSRLLVHESIASAVMDRVAALVDEIRVGHPLDVETQMGPVVSEAQYRKTLSAIESGKSDGARACLLKLSAR
jgi:2-formylbenzoate dehydrogenase